MNWFVEIQVPPVPFPVENWREFKVVLAELLAVKLNES